MHCLDTCRHPTLACSSQLDAALLVLLGSVTAVNAATAAGPGPAQGLLAGCAAALPLLGAWLGACWAAVLHRRRQRLAAAVDISYALCYVPPLIILYTGKRCRPCVGPLLWGAASTMPGVPGARHARPLACLI